MEKHQFPFGEKVYSLKQEDLTPKKAFVLGVYASAIHAKWILDGKIKCQALAIASEPNIFWDGNPEEAQKIISKINLPEGAGYLIPADSQFNGPSGRVLDEHILAPLGYSRKDVWLCDLLPESRMNPGQKKAIEERYNPLIEKFGLNLVTIKPIPTIFCDDTRILEIKKEIKTSQANTIILLGDLPIKQFLKKVTDIDFVNLKEYDQKYGYGKSVNISIDGKEYNVLPLAHPRQIGALGSHSETWYNKHQNWEIQLR